MASSLSGDWVLGMPMVTNFEKSNACMSTFSRLHKNRKSASDENVHMRDILIFPVMSFVGFFFFFFFGFLLLYGYYSLTGM